jgi:hypothetical protein
MLKGSANSKVYVNNSSASKVDGCYLIGLNYMPQVSDVATWGFTHVVMFPARTTISVRPCILNWEYAKGESKFKSVRK